MSQHDLFNIAKKEGRLVLSLYDVDGVEIHFGDIVEVLNRSRHVTTRFFCEVTYLENEQSIAPFHTFSLSGVRKVEKLPDNAELYKGEERYRYWYLSGDKQPEQDYKEAQKYLMSWKDCEHKLEERMFRIEIK